MGQLTGKVAVVTGASSEKGIGGAIALRFAQEGASVYLVAEGTEERLRQVRDECAACPGAGRVEYGVFDLSERGAAECMIAEADRMFGHIDVLVNNAALRAPVDFGDYTRDTFDKVLAVNIATPFFACQSVLPIMRRQGGGRIINIASQMAKVAYAQRALYGLTKAALVHLTRSIAYEVGRENIMVNAISPGPIRTQFTIDRELKDPEEWQRRVDSYVPIGRLGKPEEIADVALYLATTTATFLQGEDICIDGGYTSH